jgi:hypothetical protein
VSIVRIINIIVGRNAGPEPKEKGDSTLVSLYEIEAEKRKDSSSEEDVHILSIAKTSQKM